MRWVAVGVVLVVSAVAFGSLRRARPAAVPPLEAPRATMRIERDGLSYEYSAIHDRESLFDLTEPEPRTDRAAERAEDVDRMRKLLLQQSGKSSLEELREPFREQIEALKRLGYL